MDMDIAASSNTTACHLHHDRQCIGRRLMLSRGHHSRFNKQLQSRSLVVPQPLSHSNASDCRTALLLSCSACMSQSHTSGTPDEAATQLRSPAKPKPAGIGRRSILTALAMMPLAATPSADAKPPPGQGGDWTSPGLASVEDDAAPRFLKTDSGVKIQELRVGSGTAAKAGDRVLIEYVLRRPNGYFIYSTVEGVSFQPRDVPTGPVELTLGDGRQIAGLEEVLTGMQPAGKRRALVPPGVGYVSEGLEPWPPNFGARRQVINHANEPLIFEVQLVKMRS